jgi:hypothetical protein
VTLLPCASEQTQGHFLELADSQPKPFLLLLDNLRFDQGVGQVRASKISFTEAGTEQVHAAQFGMAQDRASQVSVYENGTAQVCFAEIGFRKTRRSEIRVLQSRVMEFRPAEVGMTEIRVAQVCETQVYVREFDGQKIGKDIRVLYSPMIPGCHAHGRNGCYQPLEVLFIGHRNLLTEPREESLAEMHTLSEAIHWPRMAKVVPWTQVAKN